MTRLPKRARQALAVLLLLALLLATWSIVARPVLGLARDRQADIEALSAQLAQLQAIVQRRPALQRRAQAAAENLVAQPLFWSGSSQTAIASRMQDLLRTAATRAGGQVESFSELGTTTEDGFTRLGVRARVNGSVTVVHEVLATIEAASPPLIIETLELSATETLPNAARPPQLGMEIGFSGYTQAAP